MTAPLSVCIIGRLRSRRVASDGDRPGGLAAASIATLVDGHHPTEVTTALPSLAADPTIPIERAEPGRYRLTSIAAGDRYWRANLPPESWVVPDD